MNSATLARTLRHNSDLSSPPTRRRPHAVPSPSTLSSSTRRVYFHSPLRASTKAPGSRQSTPHGDGHRRSLTQPMGRAALIADQSCSVGGLALSGSMVNPCLHLPLPLHPKLSAARSILLNWLRRYRWLSGGMNGPWHATINFMAAGATGGR